MHFGRVIVCPGCKGIFSIKRTRICSSCMLRFCTQCWGQEKEQCVTCAHFSPEEFEEYEEQEVSNDEDLEIEITRETSDASRSQVKQ